MSSPEIYRVRMPGFLVLIINIIFVICISQTAAAQIQPADPDSALLKIIEQLEGDSLSLENAIAEALKNATSVREAEAAYFAARATVRREKGYFDPEFFASFDHEDIQSPTASFFAGAPILETQSTTARTGLRMELPIGTELEASLNSVRLKTNSQFAFLNPQYTAFGNLYFRQPLLEGFSASARKELNQAERQMAAAKARYDQAALGISAETERAYWDLYAAERDYGVQYLIRDRAETFVREAELRAKSGLVGPGQVANAKVFLAEQELALLDNEELLDRISDQLASLIGKRPQGGKPRYLVTEEPPAEFPLQPVEILVEQALQNNYDLRAARQDVEAQQALARAAKWEALPDLDVYGSLGGNGLSGTAQDVIFGSDTLRTIRSGGLGESISQAVSRDFPSWRVGVELSIPIGARTGRGERDRLRAEVAQSEQRYIEQARSLEEQVRASYRELFHGKRRLEVARQGVDAAQEQVRVGLIEFLNGRSTAFELVRLGADYAVAQQRYSQALVRTAKAAATLKQLTSGGYAASTPN